MRDGEPRGGAEGAPGRHASRGEEGADGGDERRRHEEEEREGGSGEQEGWGAARNEIGVLDELIQFESATTTNTKSPQRTGVTSGSGSVVRTTRRRRRVDGSAQRSGKSCVRDEIKCHDELWARRRTERRALATASTAGAKNVT
eukprot:ctg_616.g275